MEGETVDNKRRLEVLKQLENLIEEEKIEQEKLEQEEEKVSHNFSSMTISRHKIRLRRH